MIFTCLPPPTSLKYLNNMSHGQNLSSTSGEPEFVAQYFFEIPASGIFVQTITRAYGSRLQRVPAQNLHYIPCCVSVVHYTENSIYVVPEKELCGLSPNSCINVSVSNLYIPRIVPHIWLQQNRQTDPGNIYISHRYMSVGIGRQNIKILF
jgi:hypothetical protein